MKIDFIDGTTMELDEDKIWQVHRAIEIYYYETELKDCYKIIHKDTNTEITDDERHQLAVSIKSMMMDNTYYGEVESDVFQDCMNEVLKNNDCEIDEN